ncbi:ABC transporter permease [Microbacterium capsulatum]|uniref:ABC transporter permease n=1 Tax=Microbacterium capsulatum TaxID=3041921 RepID=A0ABU0XHU0_9MICO|nr:ABC transporter permease [Microbacterium sp. ASV81]MDQ4214689.1 ABC transporter permease [Microbacterium sp. ASV81]
MARYLLMRFGQALITLVLAVVVIFIGVRMLPGDAADVLVSQDTSGRLDVNQVREALGLNAPLPVQFVRYVGGLLHGNWGMSISTGQPVTVAIGQTLPLTLQLTFMALFVATICGILFGIVASLRKGRIEEWATNGVALFFLSVPSFWLGMILILVFAVTLHWLPASGFTPFFTDPVKNLVGMIMPVFVLSTGLSAVTMRQTRAGMLETLGSDFIRSARAHGLPRHQVIWGHAVRNSVIAVVTIVNLQLGFLIAGAVVTEQVFVLPGFGKLMLGAIASRDYAVVQGVVIVIALLYVTINLLTDVVYTLIDPRVRISGRKH